MGSRCRFCLTMEWVSVDECLPEEDTPVLIAGKSFGIDIDRVSNPKDGNIWENTEKSVISHWRELPHYPDEWY